MAIQGTQVPMYIKHTLFLYFLDFSIFYLFLYEKKKTIQSKIENNQTKTCLNSQNIKTRLTQNMKANK